jgi:uncharacterized PurR-regulated membrane protein YhhQ (DUF165 family)
MADVEDPDGVGVAEPEECSRRVFVLFVGCIAFPLFVFSQYLIADVFGSRPTTRLTILAFVSGILGILVACCLMVLFMNLVSDWNAGHTEGNRLVDALI